MGSECNRDAVLEALREVIDPEIGLNIVDLGLVYEIDLEKPDRVSVTMGVTTETCPLGPYLVENAENALRAKLPQRDVEVSIAHEPAWTPDRMSAKARQELGWE